MLSGFVVGMSLLTLVGGLVGLLAGAGLGMGGPMIFGLLLLTGSVFERRYQNKLPEEVPGPGWERTGETRKNPAEGAIIDIRHNQASGEHRVARAQ